MRRAQKTAIQSEESAQAKFTTQIKNAKDKLMTPLEKKHDFYSLSTLQLLVQYVFSSFPCKWRRWVSSARSLAWGWRRCGKCAAPARGRWECSEGGEREQKFESTWRDPLLPLVLDCNYFSDRTKLVINCFPTYTALRLANAARKNLMLSVNHRMVTVLTSNIGSTLTPGYLSSLRICWPSL